MQGNMNFTQFAKYIQNQAVETLCAGNIDSSSGLCSKFAYPLIDSSDYYLIYDFMRYILGDGLYRNYLGEKYELTPTRIAVCNYLANCSIRTLRRYVAKMHQNKQLRKETETWRLEPIPSIAKVLKF